jgi:hypothetical protein
MQEKKIQEYLIDKIKAVLPPGTSLVDTLAQNLHLSSDSAYRRIRGETPLVLEEAYTLCHIYGLSLDDALAYTKDNVTFKVMGIDSSVAGFDAYWKGLLQTMKAIASFEKKQIIYLSKDMPFFHNFCFPELFAFRHFFWMKSILRHAEFEEQQFSFDCITPEIAATGRAILETYNKIPSTEIWNNESINSTLSQIEHYTEAGYFKSKDDISLLYEKLQKTIEHVQVEAEMGCKFMPGESYELKDDNYTFFFNRVVLGDNTIVVLHDERKTVYLNYDVLNYMYTHDATFCDDVHSKLSSLMKRATLLSRVSEKQRAVFFNSLYRRIEHSRKTQF